MNFVESRSSKNYYKNRKTFIETATKLGFNLTKYTFENGSDREYICDVATIGCKKAKNVFVCTSGIHGVELSFTSKIQTSWLLAASELTKKDLKKVKLVFVHALNPYGAVHGTIVDHEHNDVNRNFVSFEQWLPDSINYYQLASAFKPKSFSPYETMKSYLSMINYCRKFGVKSFTKALAEGQYTDSKGLYYGGKTPSWSRNTWDQIIQNQIATKKTRKIVHCDLHSGVGKYGEVSLLVNNNLPTINLLKSNHILSRFTKQTSNAFTRISGDIVDYWKPSSKIEIYPFAMEIGTSKMPKQIEGLDILHAMIRRNILEIRYKDDHPKAKEIIDKTTDIFHPKDPKWEEEVMLQTMAIGNKLRKLTLNI